MTEGINSNGNVHDDSGRFVSLRDYIIDIMREREKLYIVQRQSDEERLRLQAKEYERRLGLLNNSFERSAKDREDFVTKDVYISDLKSGAAEVKALALKLDDALVAAVKAVDVRFDALDKQFEEDISPLKSFKDKAAWMGPALVILGGVLGSAITRVVLGN